MRKVTIVLPISREYRLEPMRDQLETLDTQGLDIDLLVISDNIKIGWDNCRILYMDENHPGEANSYARRQRIADIMNLARTNIPQDTQDIFILEDDTEIKPHYLKKLVALTHYKPNYGLISAIQAGRWAASMIGVWKTDNIHNPSTWTTQNHAGQKLLQPVDATGIYCTLTRAELFKTTPFHCTYQGPDVNYGLDIRRKGYQNYADWTLPCGHVTPQKTIWPTPQTDTIQYITDPESPGGWKQTKPSDKITK